MKKYVLMAAVMMTVAAPGLVLAQSAPQNGNGGPPPMNGGEYHPGGGSFGGAQGAGMAGPEHFTERKAEILQHINERIADMEKRKACVAAAKDHQALRACIPPRGDHGGPDSMGGGMMGGQPPQGGPQGGPPNNSGSHP